MLQMKMKSDEFKEENRKQRLEFVKFWADYVIKNPNKVWSKQQASFINSVMSGQKMDRKTYLSIKKTKPD